MRVLLTGFEPFGKLRDNPSMRLVQQLSAEQIGVGLELVSEVLPTSYARSTARIRELLDEHQPRLCICLGVAQNRPHICLERIAVNLDDCSLADNDGELLQGRAIEDAAPLALQSGLDLHDLVRRHEAEEGQPALQVSNHAGNFVCNHVYFSALQHIASRGMATQCLFIHVPMTRECQGEHEQYGWELPSQAGLAAAVTSLAARIAAAVRDRAGTA